MTLKPALSKRTKEAGVLLAENLRRFRNSDSVVVAVSRAAAVVGHYLASELLLPLEVAFCKEIIHPGDKGKTIGSISAEEILVHTETYDIPQDYIYHQVILGQNALRHRQSYYNSALKPRSLNGKAVILVCDVLNSSDSVKATLKSTWNKQPREIIIAAVRASPTALRDLTDQVNEIHVLKVENRAKSENFVEDYIPLKDEEVRNLISKSINLVHQD